MSQEAPSPEPEERPADAPSAAARVAAETVYLELTATNLRRITHSLALVRRPGVDVIQEFRSQLIPGPPETISITITNTRATLGEKTYSLRNITSVSITEAAKNVGCASVLIGMGVLLFVMLMCSGALNPFGGGADNRMWFFAAIVLVGIGIAMYLSAKEKYAVHVSSASGEVDGFMSEDENTIQRIHDALQKALIDNA